MRCLRWHSRHQTCTVHLSPFPSTLLPTPTQDSTPHPHLLPLPSGWWLCRGQGTRVRGAAISSMDDSKNP